MPLPELRHGLICEDIRLERRNLSSFMGVYGFTPHVGIRVSDFKLSVGFCIVFGGDPAQGKYVIDAELRNPDGTRIEAEVQPKGFEFTFAPDMGGSIMAFRFRAIFAGPNTYTVVLMNGGKVFHSDTFKLHLEKPSDFSS